MMRMSHLLVMLTVLVGLLPAPRASAQQPDPSPAPTMPSDDVFPDPLPGLPRPPDQPRSLYEPAPPAPPYRCDPLPGPYFERDPRLDPPALPQPGWFTDVELGFLAPHVKNRLVNTVQVAGAPPDVVHLPSAVLDWTVSPRFEVGYRLPSGFGDFALSYRFLISEGTEVTQGPDAAADLKSRLDLHEFDLDYISREFSLWPHWDMRWRFGIRLGTVYFDSLAVEPPDAAAAGTGIFAARTSNHFIGAGPHLGVEVARRFDPWGLSMVLRTDGASLFGRTTQNFAEESVFAGPDGLPLAGLTHTANAQTVPVFNLQLGIGWQPPRYPCSHFFLGYEYEYWWDVGRLSLNTSRGELSDQGILLRAELNF